MGVVSSVVDVFSQIGRKVTWERSDKADRRGVWLRNYMEMLSLPIAAQKLGTNVPRNERPDGSVQTSTYICVTFNEYKTKRLKRVICSNEVYVDVQLTNSRAEAGN